MTLVPEMDERTEFGLLNPFCWVCGRSDGYIETHEITRGVHRNVGVEERCTWIRLCREDHERFGDYTQWPIARQLAVKLICDPDYYDRQRVNLIRNARTPDAITEQEVAKYVHHLVAMHWMRDGTGILPGAIP